jgi:hypothetical protein
MVTLSTTISRRLMLISDVPPGFVNLFRRQIAPAQSASLTVHTLGSVMTASPLQTHSFAYIPLAEFAGIDSFTFRATDNANASIMGTATVTVKLVPPASDNALLRLPALRRSP